MKTVTSLHRAIATNAVTIVLTVATFGLLVPRVPAFWAFILSFCASCAIATAATWGLLRVVLCPFCGTEHLDEEPVVRAARVALSEHGYGVDVPATAALVTAPPVVYLSPEPFTGAILSASGLWAAIGHHSPLPFPDVVTAPFGVELVLRRGDGPVVYERCEGALRVAGLVCPQTSTFLEVFAVGTARGGWVVFAMNALRIVSGAMLAAALVRAGFLPAVCGFIGYLAVELLSVILMRAVRGAAQSKGSVGYFMSASPLPHLAPLWKIAEDVQATRGAGVHTVNGAMAGVPLFTADEVRPFLEQRSVPPMGTPRE